MTMADRALSFFVFLFRRLSSLKGAYRVARAANTVFLKAGCSPLQQAKMRDGSIMLIDLRSQTEWFAFYSGEYDDALLRLLNKLLCAFPTTFLDVGGNIGMYAVRVGLTGRGVICFEPMPQNAERIRDNAILNGLADQLEVVEAALSDQRGAAELVLREDFKQGSQTGNASLAISSEADQNFASISVPVRTFDDYLYEKGEPKISVAKIDIEGHEDLFLAGAAEWVARDRPIILTEVNNWFFERRGLDSASAFKNCLPPDYHILLVNVDRSGDLRGSKISTRDLPILKGVKNCLLYPPEKAAPVKSLITVT